MPDVPEPTSFALTKGFYIRASDIFKECISLMNLSIKKIDDSLLEPYPHDIPGSGFKPFSF